MDKLAPVPGIKLEMPVEILGAFQAFKGVADSVNNALWWGAFQQGLLWGVVAVCVVWLIANQRRSQ